MEHTLRASISASFWKGGTWNELNRTKVYSISKKLSSAKVGNPLYLNSSHVVRAKPLHLLTATGVNAMGQLFPLAFAVVDAENDSNWLWFLDTLCKSIITPHAPGFLENDNLVLLSDRQKGLIDGVGAVFPDCPHGYCLRHLQENFHKVFKNVELKELLWRAARA